MGRDGGQNGDITAEAAFINLQGQKAPPARSWDQLAIFSQARLMGARRAPPYASVTSSLHTDVSVCSWSHVGEAGVPCLTQAVAAPCPPWLTGC